MTEVERELVYAPADDESGMHRVSCGCKFNAESTDRDTIVELLEGHACPMPSMASKPVPAQSWHESVAYVLVAVIVTAGLVAFVALVTGHVPW